MQWKGPFKVMGKVNDYKVKVRGKIKTYGNTLQKYFRRVTEEENSGESDTLFMSRISVIETDESECSEPEYSNFSNKNRVSLQLPIAESKEYINDVQVHFCKKL